MNIEFRTIFDEASTEYLAQAYVKHFIEKQNKQYNTMLIIAGIISAFSLIMGAVTKNYALCAVGPVYMLAVYYIIRRAKKKTIPKSFVEHNKVGCPYNVTFGLYDEYFYQKFEDNMMVCEDSIRYEFLKKILETPECFILMTQRSNFFLLPKNDMGYEAALQFSHFCQGRLPHIYSFEK